MKKLQFTLKILAIAMFTLAFASLARAQAYRTWVSGTGNDNNPCSRTAPCKTFIGAYNKTAEGGEIDALDPGGYGTLTITRALTIDGGTGSGWAGVIVAPLNGITVDIATSGNHPNDAVVVLRNLSFNGQSQGSIFPGAIGIKYFRGANLFVEHCQFQNLSSTGIQVSLGNTSGRLTVRDSVFDNVNTVITSDATAQAFSVIQFENNRAVASTNGLNANTNTYANVKDSYFGSFTGSNGAVRAGTGSEVNVVTSTFVNNNTGVNVNGGTIRLSDSEFFDNTTAISGTAESANNNKFSGNTTDGTTTNVVVVK